MYLKSAMEQYQQMTKNIKEQGLAIVAIIILWYLLQLASSPPSEQSTNTSHSQEARIQVPSEHVY